MNKLSRFLLYSTKYAVPRRRFHRLAWEVQGVKERMQVLNGQRQRLQQEIVKICGRAEACQTCTGLCCRGGYDHFTLIDYLVRMYSDRPLADYGDALPKQPPAYRIIPEKILESLRGRDEFDEKRESRLSLQGGCPNLTATGCRLAAADRPIRCVLWTCMALRRSLSDEDFRELGTLVKELSATAENVLQAFRGR